MGPGLAQPAVAPDPTRPQIGTQLPRRGSSPSGSHDGAQALVATAPESRVREKVDGAVALGGLRLPGRSGSAGSPLPPLRAFLWQAHRPQGASKEEAQVLISGLNTATLSRHHAGFKAFVRFGARAGPIPVRLGPEVFLSAPLWRLSTLAKQLAQTSPNPAQNAYAVLTLFPDFHQLWLEPTLRTLKRRWDVSAPKCHMF